MRSYLFVFPMPKKALLYKLNKSRRNRHGIRVTETPAVRIVEKTAPSGPKILISFRFKKIPIMAAMMELTSVTLLTVLFTIQRS